MKLPKLYLTITFFLLVFSLSGCKTVDRDLEEQDWTPFLSQDLNSLITTDGRIVESRPVNVKSEWADKTECFKIKYLSDGLKVVGFVVRPKVDGSKYPLIIFNRGGNREFGKITAAALKYLTYLSSGEYVVLASQYRGNDGGQGKEEFGGKDVNDVLNLIKMARSLPFINVSQIVMLGFSRGGMMTYLAVKNGAEIKAAAVVGGITDLGQMYSERDDGMKNVIRVLVGMDRSEWAKRSAFYWPEKINVPILILHGENDWRVKVSQAQKLSKKLTEAGKIHKLVVYPKGDHGLNTHRSQRNRRIIEWFEKYIER
ncbi:MAG: S9 family peptidase [Bacteroidetes bacterium]|nr:S9 family peptidase [Bacteroidota bacterium]